MKVRILLYFLTLFVCINSFAQTKGSLKLGAKISDVDLKYDKEKPFFMIISHADMTKGYYAIYNDVEYFVGLNDLRRIEFISTSDKEFYVDSIQYLKIRFRDLQDSFKRRIYYEAPFAYTIKINEDWSLAFDYEDRKKRKGGMSLKNNALPMCIFKRK